MSKFLSRDINISNDSSMKQHNSSKGHISVPPNNNEPMLGNREYSISVNETNNRHNKTSLQSNQAPLKLYNLASSPQPIQKDASMSYATNSQSNLSSQNLMSRFSQIQSQRIDIDRSLSDNYKDDIYTSQLAEAHQNIRDIKKKHENRGSISSNVSQPYSTLRSDSVSDIHIDESSDSHSKEIQRNYIHNQSTRLSFTNIDLNSINSQTFTNQSTAHDNSKLKASQHLSTNLTSQFSSTLTLDSLDHPSPKQKTSCIYNHLFNLIVNEPIFSLALSEVLPQSTIPTVSQTLLDLSLKAKTSPALALSLIHQEIYANQNTPQSIFRSNSLAAKFLGGYVYRVGKGWLKLVIGSLLAELLDSEVSLELDEDKLSRTFKDLSKEEIHNMALENAKHLENWTTLFLNRIMDRDVIVRMPSEVYLACKYISQISDSLNLDTPVVIGAFIMLRFINPGIATPEIFNLIDLKKKTPRGQRNLILVSKVIQNLANGIPFSGTKEPYMILMNDYVIKRMELMRQYFTSIVTQDGMENFTYDMEAYCPYDSVKLESNELKGMIQLHRYLLTYSDKLLYVIFSQCLSQAMTASQLSQLCIEFILSLEQAGAPLTDSEENEVIMYQTKIEMNLQKGLKEESITPSIDISEGKKNIETYNIVSNLFDLFASLVQKHANEIDNSFFDDTFVFYNVQIQNQTKYSTYCLIVRRITSKLISNMNGFIFHILKTLGENLGKPIRLIIDFTFSDIFDNYQYYIYEVLDLLSFIMPQSFWSSLNGEIIVLNYNGQDTKFFNLLSYIQETRVVNIKPKLSFVNSSEFEKYFGSNCVPLLSLKPLILYQMIQVETILGVKQRQLFLGTNSLIEVDPETQIITTEHRLIDIDEIDEVTDSPTKIRLVFHSHSHSDIIFKDLEPNDTERKYFFSTIEEKEEFFNLVFNTSISFAEIQTEVSFDLTVDDEIILKLMKYCILIIHTKQRRIQETLPLSSLQYARIQQSNLQIQMLDEQNERSYNLNENQLAKKEDSERCKAESFLYAIQISLNNILIQQHLSLQNEETKNISTK